MCCSPKIQTSSLTGKWKQRKKDRKRKAMKRGRKVGCEEALGQEKEEAQRPKMPPAPRLCPTLRE